MRVQIFEFLDTLDWRIMDRGQPAPFPPQVSPLFETGDKSPAGGDITTRVVISHNTPTPNRPPTYRQHDVVVVVDDSHWPLALWKSWTNALWSSSSLLGKVAGCPLPCCVDLFWRQFFGDFCPTHSRRCYILLAPSKTMCWRRPTDSLDTYMIADDGLAFWRDRNVHKMSPTTIQKWP